MVNIKYSILILLFWMTVAVYLLLVNPVHAQGLNFASVYEVNDKDAVSGDILISAGEKGLQRTNVSYDSKVFGVLQDNPLIVLREASSSARPVIRNGDTFVNVNDYNGEIKKGDYISASPMLGKGMKAGQSGYVVGIALENATYSNDQPTTIEGKQTKKGTVKVAMRIEFAELTTARSNVALFSQLNSALFRSIQNPEKFTLTIRYIVAGLIALIAFAIAFFTVGRSVTKAIEAIGRNPLARNTIMASIIFQLVIAIIGGIATVAVIYIIIRI